MKRFRHIINYTYSGSVVHRLTDHSKRTEDDQRYEDQIQTYIGGPLGPCGRCGVRKLHQGGAGLLVPATVLVLCFGASQPPLCHALLTARRRAMLC